MTKRLKVPVTVRAVVQRINRALEGDGQKLKIARGELARQDLGEFYIINVSGNYVAEKHVDLAQSASKLGVLKPWEVLAES